MHAAIAGPDASIAGRRLELEALGDFLAGDGGSAALLLTGDAGVGKTTLWEAGVDRATKLGFRVLDARPNDAEAQLAFAALTDLLDGVDLADLPSIPSPQRGALEVALLRAEPAGELPDVRAIGMGFVNALRELAGQRPVLIAIDDVHWLDNASADVLVFALRRLEEPSLRFLLSERRGTGADVASALERRLRRIEVGPLSLGATRKMLSSRLGLTVPRRVLRSIFDASEGNPLFALELGRTLVVEGIPNIGDDIPIPNSVEDLLGTRVAQLAPPVRRLLLAIALSRSLRLAELRKIAEPAAIDGAVGQALVVVDGNRARAAHPLLAAAAIADSSAAERETVHRTLARVVSDRGLRARHLAIAGDTPDAGLAAEVAAAAASAAARGARWDAVELGEHALRLTPADAPERPERVLVLADYLETAGELQRLTDVLRPELESLPAGRSRARAWLFLAEGSHIGTVADYRRHVERALDECGDDPELRARAVAKASSAVVAVERIPEAETEAFDVLPVARRAGADVERRVLFALAWSRALRGKPIDDVCARFEAASPVAADMIESPERVAVQRHVWRGELDRARTRLTHSFSLADERGEAGAYAYYRLHVCELELRVGNWGAAARLLDEWAESGDRDVLVPPMYERCRALLAVGRGDPDEAEAWSADAIERAEAIGVQWDWLEAVRARGSAALLAHAPERAAEDLGLVWRHTVREGVDEPGVFPVAPDLVESLAEIGALDEASGVVVRLRELATAQEHPWGLASANRCAAVVELAAGYGREAGTILGEAADEYERLGFRFDRARAVLALGRAQRRHRKWAAARRSLEAAAAAFEQLESSGWAREARSELGRVSARPPRAPGALTPAERRVVELAGEGLTNKEIARTLVVTVHTVEVHLSHAYAKLGVRSRAQLARTLRTLP